jgi:predicted acetyltransferase
VTVEIRTCAREEVNDALAPIGHFFGRTPGPERTERFFRVLEPARMHAAWEDGRAVGGAGAFSFQLTVPGGRVPAAGVTVVGVLPTHRRRGILTAMTRSQLDDVHRRGEPLAALWASEETIYGRFGYGMASLTGEFDLERVYGAFRAPLVPEGQARLVGVEEALDLLPPIYERVASRTPGMFARSPDWWETRSLSKEGFAWAGEGEQFRAVLELDSVPAAYAIYRVTASWEAGSSTGVVRVAEAMGDGGRATAQIWRYLLDIDWLRRIEAPLEPVDHPLFLLLVEPRRMRFRIGDALWLRLVDVGAALSARTYAGPESVVFEVRDEFCPWNDGRWRLQDGRAERTTAPAELSLPVADLASTYLGGFTFAQLARAGRLEERADRAVERADALFRTDRAPWCPEIF